ncbi:hypothetical protein DL96DRAFT_1760073 [Flagelloscypha sp. PMI_526]|nr:hypothetical protein DL96DRAFT_1760073 [Flagelloscypha sp. PMI_526]
MNSASSTTPSSYSSKEPLPLDIIFIILDLFLSSNPSYNTVFQLALLSRAVYDWILPRLYHTLDIGTPPEPHTIDSTVLLTSAQPSSLLFARRLFSRHSYSPLTFSLFSKVTHLSLWGRNYLNSVPLGTKQAHAILMLPLEELIVTQQSDNYALLQELTDDKMIWKTLRRFGCYHHPTYERADEPWLKCPNLTDIVVFCANVDCFIQNALRNITLPPSPQFQSYIISPTISGQLIAPKDALKGLSTDPRIVAFCKVPQHVFDNP